MTTEVKSKHWIYFHAKPFIEHVEIFYVGQCNSIKRAYSKDGRGLLWNRTVKKYGYEVIIAHDNLTKEQANYLEKYYIKEFGRREAESTLCRQRKSIRSAFNKNHFCNGFKIYL